MRAVLLQDSPTLPPKPAAPPGRAVLWVYVLGEPGFVYRDLDYAVDAGVIDQHVKRFALLTGRGYRPPLAVQHPEAIHEVSTLAQLRALPEGLRAGEILEVRRHVVDGRAALIAAVSPAMPAADVARAVSLGQLKYFSPGLGPVQTDEGDVLSLVLKELSIVTAPHQKTAPTHVLGQEQGEAMEPEDKAPDMAALMAALADYGKRLEAMEARMGEMAKMMEGPTGGGAESEDPKMEAMMAEIAALKERAFLAPLPGEVVVKIDRALLGELHRKDEALAARIVKAQVQAPAATKPVGSEGAAAPPADPQALYKACLGEAGGDRVKANEIYQARRRAQLSGGV